MRIKLDENLPAGLADELRQFGHDVDTTPDEGLEGQTHPRIWEAAQTAQRFGHTPAEALREVERAKAAWLEAARAEGKPIPPPRYRPAIYQSTS